MKLWVSGEVWGDVADAFIKTLNEVEATFNAAFEKNDYGPGLKKWAYIAIILPLEDEDYPEISKYSKRTKIAEFRLRISHGHFKNGDPTAKIRLLCESLLRALKMFPELGVVDIDQAKLEHDFIELGKKQGWLQNGSSVS